VTGSSLVNNQKETSDAMCSWLKANHNVFGSRIKSTAQYHMTSYQLLNKKFTRDVVHFRDRTLQMQNEDYGKTQKMFRNASPAFR